MSTSCHAGSLGALPLPASRGNALVSGLRIPPGLGIREAGPAEFREVAEMHYPVWRKSYTGIIPETEFPRLGDPACWAGLDYPAKLTPDGWAMWLAECGGEPVGMSIFGPDTSGADRMERNCHP